jgi:TatD DNase family protein
LQHFQIGINLTDPVYRGLYHGKRGHDDDFEDVLKRAVVAGCEKLMVTGSDLQNSKEGIKLAEEHGEHLRSTVLYNC